jgi:hypothetical protein
MGIMKIKREITKAVLYKRNSYNSLGIAGIMKKINGMDMIIDADLKAEGVPGSVAKAPIIAAGYIEITANKILSIAAHRRIILVLC